jgi:hypothetical protein
MLLAGRDYDSGWIRALAAMRGALANIAPRCNRSEPIRFSPYLYRACNVVERFSTRSSTVAGSQCARTSWQQTISLSFSLHRSGHGCASMIPRLGVLASLLFPAMRLKLQFYLRRSGLRSRRNLRRARKAAGVGRADVILCAALHLSCSACLRIEWGPKGPRALRRRLKRKIGSNEGDDR